MELLLLLLLAAAAAAEALLAVVTSLHVSKRVCTCVARSLKQFVELISAL